MFGRMIRRGASVPVQQPESSDPPAPTSTSLAALCLLRVSQRIRVVGDALPGTPRRTQGDRNFRVAALALAVVLALASCSSLEVDRTTQTSGTFTSKGTGVLLLWYEIPMNATDIARENAADSRLTNMQVTEAYEYPKLGWFEWIYQILGLRFAVVKGTWGFTGEGQ